MQRVKLPLLGPGASGVVSNVLTSGGNVTDRRTKLFKRVRTWTLVFIAGVVVSGVTAIPLQSEIDWLVRQTGAEEVLRQGPLPNSTGLAAWLISIRDALHETNAKYPFLAYGTDWLAFGHFVIALAFVGLLRDPVRNRWLIDFGLIACALVLPYALIFGGLRGIPFGWRLVDCSFGVFGALPLWRCRRLVDELERVPNECRSGELPTQKLNPQMHLNQL